MFNFLRRRPFERPGFALYGAAVAAARAPVFYARLGVPDTLPGRFDMVGLFAVLLVRRLGADPDPRGRELAQAVFDAMFADMDVNLRELGVGDMNVGKRVKRLAEAFNGRAHAYDAALAEADDSALAAALMRNVWGRAGPEPEPGAALLATHARAQAARLEAQPFALLLAGEAGFLPPPDVA